MRETVHLEKIVWNVTNKCNFNCDYCYADSGPAKPIGLDTASVLRIAEDVNNSGVKFVSLIGGEPLMRSDINEILDALDRDIFIRLDTNGVLLQKKWTSALENVNSFSIGIDGAPIVNQIFRERTSDATQAIEFLLNKGKSVSVPMLVNSLNYRDVGLGLSFIFSLGIKRVQINKYIPPIGLKSKGLTLTVSEESIALQLIQEFLSSNPDKECRVDFNGWKHEEFFKTFRKASNEPPRCRCGDLSAAIDYSGSFVPCTVLANDWAMPILKKIYTIPNLLENSIRDAYTDSSLFMDFRYSSGFMSSKCVGCRFKFSCNHGCRGYSLLSARDIFSEAVDCSM